MFKGRSFAIYIYNMRHPKITTEEILEAEKSKDDRQRSRVKGFDKMKERDAGFGRLRDYQGKAQEIYLLWGYEGKFKLDIRLYGGETVELVLDAEEFRRYLRWA